jgi:hypothetical protein
MQYFHARWFLSGHESRSIPNGLHIWPSHVCPWPEVPRWEPALAGTWRPIPHDALQSCNLSFCPSGLQLQRPRLIAHPIFVMSSLRILVPVKRVIDYAVSSMHFLIALLHGGII